MPHGMGTPAERNRRKSARFLGFLACSDGRSARRFNGSDGIAAFGVRPILCGMRVLGVRLPAPGRERSPGGGCILACPAACAEAPPREAGERFEGGGAGFGGLACL